MNVNKPLAERMRPSNLDEYIGQKHLLGDGASLRNIINSGNIPSIIFWGPPGVGKTTLANVISNHLDCDFYNMSAIHSGVKDIRDIVDKIKGNLFSSNKRPILFIDEIHRFSKSQQDSLLPHIENGTLTLIGATTENPSFEIIRPLISRCQVFKLKPFDKDDIVELVNNTVKKDFLFKDKKVNILETDSIIRLSGGDARKTLNILELIATTTIKETIDITNELVVSLVEENPIAFDKNGELHYDIASAFIKSIRGSDPDAAIYYLARLLEGGEDPQFIARRLLISASEDIGLANPNAILIAEAAAHAVDRIGMPECRIPLAEATIYLATCEKSNSAYNAINRALDFVRQTGNLPVPIHLRNGVTELMRKMNYGKDYMYPHDYTNHFVKQEYLPNEIKGTVFYTPCDNNNTEKQIQLRQKQRWQQ